MNWNKFIRRNWKQLTLGRKLWVTSDFYSHPRHLRGFRVNIGWPVGQSRDYTMSLGDGSRIHVQEFGQKGGLYRFRVHRDAYDPDQGLGNWLLHGLLETPVVPMIAGVAIATSLINELRG